MHPGKMHTNEALTLAATAEQIHYIWEEIMQSAFSQSEN